MPLSLHNKKIIISAGASGIGFALMEEYIPNKTENLHDYLIPSIGDVPEIECNFVEGAPGVYVDRKKIASIGLRISKGKSYHGISLNFDMDLSPFKQINPCGYKGLEVTQIKDLNKDISKLQLEALAIDLLRKIF